MENNKSKVRQVLAYLFGGGVVAYFFVSLFGKIVYGVEVVVPTELITLAAAIIAFYFGTEAGKEKPEV